MRRWRISGQVIGGCAACCAAAILLIGLMAVGHGIAGGSSPVLASNVLHRSPQAHSALPLAKKNLKDPGVIEKYRQFPLSFEPNQQQTSPEVKFLARGEGYILFLTGNEAVFSMGKSAAKPSVMRMSLVGANSKPSFAGVDELPGKSNYFIGNKPEKWHTNIPNYRKVAERNIYPGIDLLYYGTQRQLEYDFVIAPGASPSKIKLAFTGAKNLHTDANGDLVLSVAGSEDVRVHHPVAYQEIGTERRLVAANFVLDGHSSVAFQLGNYDANLPLIVDPILSYSTYLGGSNIDSSNAIAIAPDNTAFIAGGTFSTDFPTVHPLQANDGGGPDFPQDAFVSKISSDGSTLLYSTYLGGEREDFANGIALDNLGDAFITGYTESDLFPVTFNSLNLECGGDGKCGASFNPEGLIVSNAFVTKLNPAGSGIIYSTYFGEYEQISAQAIAVDANGNAYITGYTTGNFTPTVPTTAPPPPFPITTGPANTAFQTTYGGGSTNAYVAKIDATGSAVLYSSYLGGEVDDVGYGIAVDTNANAYVTGLTYSTLFPTTAGAVQTTFGGAGDAFISKVNTDGSGPSSLVYSTYMGGAGLDQGNAITVDTAGNAYVTGLTNSSKFGFTPSGLQPSYGGEGDAFVTELSTSGALSYFTYLGGTHADSGTGIAVDSSGNVYVTGTTASIDFPTAGAVFQPTYGGGNTDTFVAKIGTGGAHLVYSSYLGGTNAELATGIAVDTSGNAYVTGQTCSDDFPLANPLQPVPGGNCDAYVAKVSILNGFAFNPAGLVFSAQSLNTTSTQTVTLTNGDTSYTISSIAISGTNASEFNETNTCPISPTPIAVGATCSIAVTFAPSVQGISKASLTIIDSAPGSPHVVNLTGSTSTVTLSSSDLFFGTQNVGTSSAPQEVTVTNSGTTALTFTSIVASGDFSETDDCVKAALQPNTNCVIKVTYTPSAAISSIGSITLNDNGSGSPQVILATGTGFFQPPTFQISSTTVAPAVPAGQTATYSLLVTSVGGFSQQVGLSCTAPATITCTVTPASVTPTAAAAASATLNVSTALRTSLPPGSTIKIDPRALLGHISRIWLLWLAAVFMLLTLALVRRRPMTAAFGFTVVLLLASVACSGGSQSGVPAGTPAGTYQVTVTGTSSGATSSTSLSLQVH